MNDVVAQALADPLIPTIGLAIAATIASLWLAAAWWAYRDATHRAGSYFVGFLAAAWIVVSSPFLLPFSLAVYGLARPLQTAAEQRSRRLVRELAAQLDAAAETACPRCRREVDPTWLRCPGCATWLAQPCSACGGWSEPNLDICPWCGNEERAEPAVETLEPPEPVTVDRDLRDPQRRLVAAVGGRPRTARAH